MYRNPYGASGIPTDSLFRDIYRILEEIQETKDHAHSITTSIVHCSRELRNLERIHGFRCRFFGSESTEDPFELQEILNKFMISCNALSYINSPHNALDDDVGDGCLFPSKRGWKKKHIKALETEFFDHQRTLSLALSNAVYTSSVRMQRINNVSDTVISQIIRQSERRHLKYERNEIPSKGNSSQKSWDSKIEEMDWELCLRRYFDYVESWNPEPDSYNRPERSLSRKSSFNQSPHVPSLHRQPSYGSMHSNYGDYRRGEELDTSIFYRQPRRRSITSQSSQWQYETDLSDVNRESMSMRSSSSNALVLYNNPTQSTAVTTARPIRRASISGDFHWEYVGKSSTFSILAPLTARWPELKDAQVDIYTQTQKMSATEARAYAQGRLAGLAPEITNEVKRLLSVRNPAQERQSRARQRHTIQPHVRQDTNAPRRSTSLDSSDRSRFNPPPRPSSFSPAQNTSLKPSGSPSVPASRATASSANTGSQKSRFFSLSDLRPLTAISERPSTSKSKASSLDRPASRSFLSSFIPKKSNLSNQVLDTVPDKEGDEGRSSSGSDTLTSNRDLEIDPGSKISAKSGKPRTPPKSPVNTQKPLPPKPSGRAFRTKKTRLFAMFKPRQSESDLPLPLPPSLLSLHNKSSINQSRESLRRVSMELLKRKDSKVTLLSMTDGMDVPFDIWLRALPYIEGRVSTPKNL